MTPTSEPTLVMVVCSQCGLAQPINVSPCMPLGSRLGTAIKSGYNEFGLLESKWVHIGCPTIYNIRSIKNDG